MSNSFNWVLFFNSNIFCFIFIYTFVNIWSCTGDLCHFSLVCSVVLWFSSALVLEFTFVFIQGLISFISVECIPLRFSWNVNHLLAFKFINFSIHHHHIALVARISLTLSRHSSLSFIALGRSSGQQPVSSNSC